MEPGEKSRRVLVTPSDLIGVQIDGRYTLESVIGGGGMGVVFNTTQPTLNKPLALKLLKFDDSTDDRVLKRFERELEIVSQLSHPNIVNVIEAGRDTETSLHYVVMEKVDGVTLEEVISRYRMTPDLALDIAAQVCSALSEPHLQGVVHRDVKPANIMFSIMSDGRVSTKLLDFGIARAVDVDTDNRITTTSTVIGSPAYMAPEAASGTEVDARTDLYSFGVVLYEMLVGDVPFRGSTPVAVMLRHAVDRPIPIDERVPNFAYPELSQLVSDLLSKEPEDRPKDAREVLDRIEKIQRTYDLRPVRCHTTRDTVVESLAGHLLSRVTSDTDDDASEYGATETFRGRPSDPVNSFDGWMVAEPIAEKISGEQPVIETDDPISKTPMYVVGLTMAGVLLGLVLVVINMNDEVPVDISSETPPINSVVKTAPTEEPLATKTNNAAVEPTNETNNVQPMTNNAATTDDSEPKNPTKPRTKTKPKQREPDPKEVEVKEAPKEGEAVKGFDWIKNK